MTIPAWMTDKWFCQTIKSREAPMCAVAALIDLQDLLTGIGKPESQ